MAIIPSVPIYRKDVDVAEQPQNHEQDQNGYQHEANALHYQTLFKSLADYMKAT
jgi:hypothetical protein